VIVAVACRATSQVAEVRPYAAEEQNVLDRSAGTTMVPYSSTLLAARAVQKSWHSRFIRP
jgi:hypothetical protein